MITAAATYVDNDNYLNRLIEIIKDKSFSHGKEIKLSSGKISNMYFDMKPTMLDPEASYIISKQILNLLDQDTEFVGGLEMGAVPIVAALCPVSYLEKRNLKAFFIRKKAKEHGARKVIEGLKSDAEISGRSAVLVDDVTTSGQSVFSAYETVEKAGGRVSKIISIVDREEGAREFFKSHGIPFAPILTARDFILQSPS